MKGLWKKHVPLCLGILWITFSFHLRTLAQESETHQNQAPGDSVEYATGVVLSVKELSPEESPRLPRYLGAQNGVQEVQVKINSGSLEGQTVTLQNMLSGHPAYDIPIEPGARVLLDIEKPSGSSLQVNIADRDRFPAITLLISLFSLGLVVIGGKRGLKSFGLLLLVFILLTSLVVPGIASGAPSLLLGSILFLIFYAIGNFFLLPNYHESHLRWQLLTMILGGLLGSMATIGIMALAAWLAPLRGFSSEELAGIWQSAPEMDFKGLLLLGPTLANMGLIFHLTRSIVLRTAIENGLAFSDKFHLAFNQGKEVVGSLTNGLLLFYAGLALPLFFQFLDAPVQKLLNLESVSTLMASSLAGGLGLIMTVPLTAFLYAWLATTGPMSLEEPQ